MTRLAESEDVIRASAFATGPFFAIADTFNVVKVSDGKHDERTARIDRFVFDTAFFTPIFSTIKTDVL